MNKVTNSKINFLVSEARPVARANDTDAYVPEVWAQESLMVLEENMVAANLVHRAFSNEVAEHGDVVNTRRPANFEAVRKVSTDDVTVQDATADNVQVKLNQHIHTSFRIPDADMSKSFKNLVIEYLTPAVRSISKAVDQVILGQTYQFLPNVVGSLGTDPGKSTVIAANTKMNTNLAPVGAGQRNFIITPSVEGALLDVSDFTKVNEANDGGNALQNAMLGRKFGFDFYMDQNACSVAATQTVVTGAVNLVGGYAAGTTTLAIDGHSDTFVTGQWITIAGDMVPQLLTAVTGTPTTSISIYPGLVSAVANDAVITLYPQGTVNLSAGYVAGWVKPIVTTFSEAPLTSQMVSTGITSAYNAYSAIGTPTTIALNLDRETQAALSNGDALNLGPAGQYCLGIHPNAIALVSRPLALVPSQFGVQQAVVSHNGLSIRVSMQYSGTSQGMLVTADLLCGVKVLDVNLGVVMLG